MRTRVRADKQQQKVDSAANQSAQKARNFFGSTKS